MGWDYCESWTEKSLLIASIVKPQSNATTTWTCLAHTTVGNVLWSVWEIRNVNITDRHIRVDLLAKHNGYWGHKDMDESMEPYTYSCPLKFLDMAPVASTKWREFVKVFHASKKAQRQRKVSIQVGQYWKLIDGCKPQYVKISSVKPLMGHAGYMTWKIRARHLEMEVTEACFPG